MGGGKFSDKRYDMIARRPDSVFLLIGETVSWASISRCDHMGGLTELEYADDLAVKKIV